jgi:hypothetical protein
VANITAEHLHHMARRHHATMKKLDGIQERYSGVTKRLIGTAETGAGAWIGGAIEGRTAGGTVLKFPINLGVGALLLGAGFLKLAGPWSDHLNNIGNGFIGSYVAATGYSFGKRWRETGKILGGGGHPWAHPYETGWPQAEAPAPSPAVHGDLSEAQMAHIVHQMQAAAAAPAHP